MHDFSLLWPEAASLSLCLPALSCDHISFCFQLLLFFFIAALAVLALGMAVSATSLVQTEISQQLTLTQTNPTDLNC